jgi:hypothetical protein
VTQLAEKKGKKNIFSYSFGHSAGYTYPHHLGTAAVAQAANPNPNTPGGWRRQRNE